MNIKYSNKLIFSTALVTVLLLSISIFAFADPALGGLLAGTLAASGIESTVAGTLTAAEYDDAWKGLTENTDDWTSSLSDYNVYYQTDVIQKGGSYYDKITISHELAQFCAQEGIALQTDLALTDYDQGTLLARTNQGYIDNNLYVYRMNSSDPWKSMVFTVPTTSVTHLGETYNAVNNPTQQQPIRWKIQVSSPSQVTLQPAWYNGLPTIQYKVISLNWHMVYINRSSGSANSRNIASYNQYTVTNLNGDIDYLTGQIDLTLDNDEGVSVLIPSNKRPTGVTTGEYNKLDSEIDSIINAINDAFADNTADDSTKETYPPLPGPTPTPTPTPAPTDALGTIPYDIFIVDMENTINNAADVVEDAIDTWGQSIWSKLGSIGTIIDTIGSNIEIAINNVYDTIDNWGQSIWSKLESIRTGFTEILDDILDGIQDIADSISNLVDTIVEAIEEGPIKLIDTGIDVLRTAFGSILQNIRSHIGIWHYVVSWVQSITTPFTWILGIANGTSYYMVLPLYALVAGTIVIAVYKRFGR